MQIVNSNYKDIRSIKLTTSNLEVIVLPEYGGKIASIYSGKNDCDFLVQAPGANTGSRNIPDVMLMVNAVDSMICFRQ